MHSTEIMASPNDYNVSNKLQRHIVSSIIEEFSEDLMNICGKCMDIGCGSGDITKEFLLPSLGPNAQIIGTDISENMIKYANNKFNDQKRLQFEILNIETTKIPGKYISEFDHIFSFHTLQWCNNIRKACENIYQMLRPNGTILLYIVAIHDIYEVLRILAQDIRFAQYTPNTMENISPFHESKNARKELKDLLQNIGFTVHHCSLRETSYSEEKSKQFLTSIISILSFLEDMPQDLMEEYKDALINEYMKRKINYKVTHNNEEHTLDLFKGLVVYAQKT